MTERGRPHEPGDIEDPRKGSKLTVPLAAAGSSFVGPVYGGIAYGAARFFFFRGHRK